MMRYMLDTDIASYFIRGSHPQLDSRMSQIGWDGVCISVITKSELLFGLEISPRRDRESPGIAQFLRYIQVFDFPSEAATRYARIRAALKQRGTPIGGNDMLIAAHACHLGLTLVTNNIREFSRVPGLTIEDWSEIA